MTRAPEVLRQLALDFDVVNAFVFLPHRRAVPASAGLGGPTVNIGGLDYVVTQQLTLCSSYVSVFTAALGCCIPHVKANEQLKWLSSSEGQVAGWFAGNQQLAIQRAALGYPTVMVAYEQPHGHIAMVMPPLTADPQGLYVSAAGAQNFSFVRAERSFGHLMASAKFFTHN